jgi:hypothetical protein
MGHPNTPELCPESHQRAVALNKLSLKLENNTMLCYCFIADPPGGAIHRQSPPAARRHIPARCRTGTRHATD